MSTSTGSSHVRKVSVIAPMKNEAAHVDAFVHDLAAQDLDLELEILVADGRSDDDSVERLLAAARAAGLDITVVDNVDGTVSHGLNQCIHGRRVTSFVRLDYHTRYPATYLSSCVRASEETGAWNVGGVVIPQGKTPVEQAVALAMDNPFGGIGWTRHAGSTEPVAVDTVTYGAFRREVFEKVGLFDEDLVRNQDDEFNARIRDAGGTVVLDPRFTLFYTPRGSYAAVFRQYYEYGLWKVPVMRRRGRVLGARSLAPIALVASLGVLGVASLASRRARRLLAAEVAAYSACAIAFGVRAVVPEQHWALLPRVVAVFPTFHLSYGLGMVDGWVRATTD